MLQRIQMSLYGHPVTLDGTLIEFYTGTGEFKVVFDGGLLGIKSFRRRTVGSPDQVVERISGGYPEPNAKGEVIWVAL